MFTSSYSVGLFDIVLRVVILVNYASIIQKMCAQAKNTCQQRTSSLRLQVHCFNLHILHLIASFEYFCFIRLYFFVSMLMTQVVKRKISPFRHLLLKQDVEQIVDKIAAKLEFMGTH